MLGGQAELRRKIGQPWFRGRGGEATKTLGGPRASR